MTSDMRGGAKVGPRIAKLVSESIVYTHTKLLHVKHKLALAIFTSISDIVSDEVHETLVPIIRPMYDSHPDDSVAKPMLNFLVNKHGQWQAAVGTGLSASGLLGSISTILNNELAVSVYESVATNPHLIPDAGTIARSAAVGLGSQDNALANLAKLGFGGDWGQLMIELSRSYPDQGTALDLLRRGLIGSDTFLEWMTRAGYTPPVIAQMQQLTDVPLSPADAALALLRGNVSQADAEKSAAAYGISPATLNVMVGNTGEPLGLMELLEAYRRGFIDEARLEKGIVQSRVRNEWIDVAKALRFSPISVADAVNAVIQGHLTQDQGDSISQQNGLQPGSFGTLVETAGEPLSRTELEELFNRGLITKAQVDQGLLESRLKNKYTDLAFGLHTKLLPIRNLTDAVEYGTMSLATAVSEAMKNGYSQVDATSLIQTASARKLQSFRQQIVVAAETLVIDGAMDSASFIQLAGTLGFDEAEASAIAEGANFKRIARLTGAAISAIRSKYLARHIDTQTASGLLDGLGIIAAQRDQLLGIWGIELTAETRLLTPAEIVKAHKLGIFSDQQCVDRLVALGYSDDDANVRMQIG